MGKGKGKDPKNSTNRFPKSGATAEVTRIEKKMIHGQMVDVKIVSPASSMHPIEIPPTKITGSGKKKPHR